MRVYLNGREYFLESTVTLGAFLNKSIKEFDTVILNTVINPDLSVFLKDNDRISAFRKGKLPNGNDLEHLMFSRQPAMYTKLLKKATVGVAGLGGLGSVVGENLVRSGIGKLIVADFDVVEPPNINRQRYFIEQIGMYKTEAFKENMQKISPYTKVECYTEKITPENIEIFKDCNIVAECFDDAENKAMLVSRIREKFPEKIIVATSGVAGFESEKTITVKKISDKIYIVGDGKSEVRDGLGLVATRVSIAASMQSHLIVRLILGLI